MTNTLLVIRYNSPKSFISNLYYTFEALVTISAVESTIRWNDITGVNSLASSAQLIPFVIGVGVTIRAVTYARWIWKSIGADEPEDCKVPHAGNQHDYPPPRPPHRYQHQHEYPLQDNGYEPGKPLLSHEAQSAAHFVERQSLRRLVWKLVEGFLFTPK